MAKFSIKPQLIRLSSQVERHYLLKEALKEATTPAGQQSARINLKNSQDQIIGTLAQIREALHSPITSLTLELSFGKKVTYYYTNITVEELKQLIEFSSIFESYKPYKILEIKEIPNCQFKDKL